jgi:hypothetical protein
VRPALWFVVPAHGRLEIARICLRQLRRTCDALEQEGIDASAVVIADDENLDTALDLGFATVRRENSFLSAKFNDGIQVACDHRLNPRVVDFVVPCGSDDWVDHRIFLGQLPGPREMLAFQLAAFVDETGTQIVSRPITYQGGVGIRVYPRQMMGRRRLLGRDRDTRELVYAPPFRPADEDRRRACDTTILVNVKRTYKGDGPRIRYGDIHEYQIVDWKSRGEQLNAWTDIVNRFPGGHGPTDPFETLRNIFPSEALDEMRAHYGVREVAVA